MAHGTRYSSTKLYRREASLQAKAKNPKLKKVK